MPRRPPRLRQKPRIPLSITQILAWADNHHAQTGKWPTRNSGYVLIDSNEKWIQIDDALRKGLRGLPGGSSLARLFHRGRSIRYRKNLPPLTEEKILTWAQEHRKRTGKWPTEESGPIPDSGGEVWCNVNAALVQGFRRLPGGDTLPRLLARRFGVRNWANAPKLSIQKILRWADAYFKEAGRWPRASSGPIPQSPGDTWETIESALRQGHRGLRGKSSLARLLARHRGVRNQAKLPSLTVPKILVWADAHHRRTGRWPGVGAGPIIGAKGETWCGVAQALSKGRRGFPGGDSLQQLLARHGRGP